ncbi:MAG: RNA-binding cell elongation regulator Jag/EloR [Dehalococcoidia bacterium]
MEREEVEITVVKKGKPGLFGLVGAEEAVVEVTLTTSREAPQGESPQGESPQDEGPQDEVPQDEVPQDEIKGVLEGLLKAMNLSARVVPVPVPQGLEMSPRTVALDIRGRDLGLLIGRQGQTLASLQYLLNLMVSRQVRGRLPIVVDVEGYKRRRYEALQTLANHFADQVRKMGQPVTLEPMPAFERRLVHLALSQYPDIITESVGTGMGRKVVIRYREDEGEAGP